MSKIIIFDFEVFKYDTLLGAYIYNNGKVSLYQTWDLDEIRKFYYENEVEIWIGHNNFSYDNCILDAIVKEKNPYLRSKDIIVNKKRSYSYIPKHTYDLMAFSYKPFSLKLTEMLTGNSIHESEIDFELNRPLNIFEKRLVEKYNEDDLKQTDRNFKKMYDLFKLRLDIISEFNLDLSMLKVTGTKLAATVLNAKHDDSLEFKKVYPIRYENLQLKNEELWNYYLNEKFRTDEKLDIQIGNAKLKIGSGGIHSAEKKFYSKKCMYFDVSGYYNLIMINCNLLPRTMDKESRDKYIYMYHEQLRLKKINPVKRGLYKTILLSVFGAMINEYTDFYDPWHGLLVTITGQLFIVDLLEKLKDLVIIVQTNTDGLIVEPKDWNDEQKIRDIVDEWEKRTGFVIKKEYIYDLYQRDVNCYVCKDESGKVIYKGEAVKNFDISDSSFANGNLFDCKEPPIIAKGIVDYLLFDVLPEQTVESNKNDLIYFQYGCKQGTFDYVEYVIQNLETNEVKVERMQGLNRAFAYNSTKELGMIYKHKDKNGKHKKSKIPNLPDNIFVWNNEIMSNESKNQIIPKIDYKYYVDRIYERIEEFVEV